MADASRWIDNAKKLIDRFDGDPRNIFEIAKNYEDCVSMIKNDGSGENGFLGFREKMTSMILYFLIDEGLIPKIDFPVPVDFHVLRVSLATEMVSTEPRDVYRTNGKIEDALRQLFKKYIQERQVCSLDLTNAVWLLSSTMCNQNYGQLSDKQISEKGVSFLFKELDTNDIRHGENWHRTCGKCAIESYCKYFIPAGPYYRSSAIRPIEKPSGNFIKQIEIDDIDKNNG